MTSSAQIAVLSRKSVTSADPATLETLETPFRLGPLDSLVAPFIPVPAIFIFANSNFSDASDLDAGNAQLLPLDRLERALALLLNSYPQLTGRLSLQPDGTPLLDRLGSGADLVSAECNASLSSFPRTGEDGNRTLADFPEGGNTLLPPFNPSLEAVFSDPVLVIQHTRFACGSVSLGIRTLHRICDADGYFILVTDLAELYRKLSAGEEAPKLSREPVIRPYLAEFKADAVSVQERERVLSYEPELFYIEKKVPGTEGGIFPAEQDSAKEDGQPSSPPPPVTGRFMHFSAAELAALKAHATDPSHPGFITTFDALTAHLHQRVYLARQKLRQSDPTQAPLSPPDLLSPVNIRSRFGLGERYFGNALITTFSQIPGDTLSSAPLSEIAQSIHAMVRSPATTSKTEMESTLAWISAQPDRHQIRQKFRFGSGSFMASQWNKTDMYPIFDVKPSLVSSPFTAISLVDGLVYYLANAAGDGSIEVNLALSEPVWGVLEGDREFRRFREVK